MNIQGDAEEKVPQRSYPSRRHVGNVAELLTNIDLSWVATSDRFKNFNRTRQVLTINRKTEYEIEEFRKQETELFKEPMKPFTFTHGELKYTVGPCVRKKLQMRHTPIPHVLLKPERPPFVSILTIVRDAAARLPDGIGTKQDCAELVKDSQWILPSALDDNILNMSVGGGLDRLQAEEDPMIRFDPVTKLWVNLHFKRSIDDPRLQFENIGGKSSVSTATL